MARPELHYHKVDNSIAMQMASVRSWFIELSENLERILPAGRSASLAQTHLEDSCMRAIQALALQGEKIEAGVV